MDFKLRHYLLPRARAVTALPLLVRADSGFDGAAIFVALAAARAAGPVDWLVKWNPRRFKVAALHARVVAHARRLTLGLGQRCAAFSVFERHYQALLQFSG